MPIQTPPLGNCPRKTGARRTPPHKIAEAVLAGRLKVHQPKAAPAQVAMVPSKLNMEGNATYGDCVTAEEAASISAYSVFLGLPEATVAEATAIAWASQYGFLNGADLLSVIQQMESSGMTDDQGFLCKDGTPSTVDYTNEATLQSAISQGPVKIGIASSCLPSTAGNQQGWYSFGAQSNQGEDHCVGLWGYGPIAWLAQQLGVSAPSGATNGYLLYTWSTIGLVDFPWIQAACAEAYLRTPTTVGLQPGPTPGPAPNPPPGPTPVPGPSGNVLTLTTALAAGTYTIGGGNGPTPPPANELQDVIAYLQAVSKAGGGAPSGNTGLLLIIQGVEELFAGNSQGWTDILTGIVQLLGLAKAKPGLGPVILAIIDAVIQMVGTSFGLPQSFIDAVEAEINKLLGATAAAAFRSRIASRRAA